MENLLNELKSIKNNIDNIKSKNINDLNLNETELFIVDMNNGFAKGGSLYSPRINALINPIYNFTKYLSNKVSNITAFTDCHTTDSIELLSYPPHCMLDSFESDIIDELKSIENIKVIPKNSTNAFFTLKDINFSNTKNIIVVGDCTDICVYQFAITLKSYFNQNNISKNIIVPIDLVDTYDSEVHPANLLNMVFLNSMLQNGIEVVKTINY
ncbi:isochorismatase family cysteine hydrolase [Romboutsia sp. 1001216sp1]|uniref:isochorismatase family cysteine hydrolase n=1 Tax=Romboutsia sp. 1001216sp1 TaxID=2986997 RepID=UPI00232DA78D|nr:isochorismatase family cysteine hydrolase [Romboutsia sp. 1001216sp1]MDB8804311.1 cysteine hydrolase [Romboutsia sp. 1001216sp1]MDB8807731.1 cysteine hydrolase [Romboutsia sp. 1001216sp1]MDB8809957.1 cysteine hydrolase [Romboutsia sp. 1001216sp1]MDB8815707.1 cysteine hydrolase [Romboutsia sp. 1001216sp1]MDB8819445.1 cysteine hydrolase [Romboutsia sp. 1001216sp1]